MPPKSKSVKADLFERDSNGIRKAETACLCWDFGTVRLSPGWKDVTLLSTLLSWSSAGRMNVCLSSHTWNLIPSNPMIIISGQQDGHLHDPKHTWQISMGFSVPQLKSHSAFCCCVCLQAKGHLRLLPPSDCLLAPKTNGLFYQLPWQLFIYSYKLKGLFPPPFA